MSSPHLNRKKVRVRDHRMHSGARPRGCTVEEASVGPVVVKHCGRLLIPLHRWRGAISMIGARPPPLPLSLRTISQRGEVGLRKRPKAVESRAEPVATRAETKSPYSAQPSHKHEMPSSTDSDQMRDTRSARRSAQCDAHSASEEQPNKQNQPQPSARSREKNCGRADWRLLVTD